MTSTALIEKVKSLWKETEVSQGPDYSPLRQKQSEESVEEQVG